jgi:hypothetical protein
MACLSYQAFAVVPVVREIPSPVVTDDASPTGPYLFVYPDWVNLNSYVSDDGDLANIQWSFAAAAGYYNLNGARPLNLTTENPATPPAAAIINSQANLTATGESNPDANVLTATVRDITLSPFAGPNVPAGSTPGELVNMDTLTLFASDGTTAGSRAFIAYTEASGGVTVDRLSATPNPTPVNITTLNFAAGAQGWTQGGALGTATYSTVGGICITVSAAGVNIGEWVSPYNIIPLADNAVWRIRLTMSTTQTTATNVPLWDIIIQNLGGPASDQVYVADYFFLDNTGSANAIMGPAQGRNVFEVWYAVSAVRTPQWRTGAITPGNDPNNDMRIHFRVLDAEAAGYGGEFDSGTICLVSLVIDKFDLDNVFTSTPAIPELNPITSGISGVTVADVLGSGVSGGGSQRDFNTNPLTITPADAAGWLLELTGVKPGDSNDPTVVDAGYSEAAISDNYPVIWESNVLYELQVDLSAPNANSETRGPDSIRLGIDAKTIELFADSYILSGMGFVGTPKTVATAGGVQTYTMFFFSHSTSLLSNPTGAARFRWRVDILNTDAYNRPVVTDTRNTGGVRIHAVRMLKTEFYGQ